MKHRVERIVIGVLVGCIALSAIWGGAALLLGSYQNGVLHEAGTGVQFPVKWLSGTLFSDYTVPALVLAIVVGGSALMALLTIFTGREWGVLASLAAGIIMAGFIAVEVLTLQQVPAGPTVSEGLYFGLGLATLILAAHLWLVEDLGHHLHVGKAGQG
jgi:hypothetical protein